MKKILFVCTGNTCRSPMAEFILKSVLKQRGIKGVKVSSAGLAVDDNCGLNELAKATLKKNKVAAGKFASKQIDDDMIAKSDLVLCMTASHKRALPPLEKIKTLGETVDMPDVGDPYGGTEAVYNLCFRQLKAEIDKFVDTVLEKEQGE